MRVALDARELQPRPLGGVGRTLAQIVPRLAREVDLVLLTDARRAPVQGAGLPQHALRAPSARGSAWLQLCAPRWLQGFDGAFHCPFYGLPFRLPVPGVVTIHDLTFEHHPEWFSAPQRLAFRTQARHGARVAAAVLTVSAHVRDDLVATYGTDPARVIVAPNAVDPVFGPDRADASRTVGVDRPYMVTLGGAARRNHEAAVAAWRLARASGLDLSLVVVGVGAAALAPEPGLVVAGRVDDAEWAALLAGAEVFCYPTRYEGFGMPALEACASGTPVVAARVGALPEVLGDAAAWASDLEPESLAEALHRAVAEGHTLRQAGLARAAAAPTWDDCASAHLRAYRAASHDH